MTMTKNVCPMSDIVNKIVTRRMIARIILNISIYYNLVLTLH